MSIPLDVLQVVTSTHRRGAETFAVDLGDALDDRVRSVETVALRSSAGEGGFDLPVLGRATGAGTDRIGVATIRDLRRAVREVDVVVAHGSSTLWATAAASIGSGVPFVYRLIGDPAYWVSSRARQLRVRLLLHRAKAVTVYHPQAREVLLRLHGLDPARVHVIGKGVPLDRHPVVTTEERRAARRQFGLGDEVVVVAYVGALSAEKDVALAIEAVARLDSATTHLLLAGDGPERARLESLSCEEDVAAHFLGSTAAARSVMAASDVVVLTSRTEGVPSVLLEAGLAALPTVTTDVGGVRAVVDDGVTGFVVDRRDPDPLADALAAAVAGRAVLGAAARARCQQAFAMAPVADQWAELLATVAHLPEPD